MRVSQVINNKGNAAANQFLIHTGTGRAFQSYDSLIAFESKNGDLHFSDLWDYSATTLKHLKIFLDTTESKKELQKKIKNGSIKIVTQDKINKLMGK